MINLIDHFNLNARKTRKAILGGVFSKRKKVIELSICSPHRLNLNLVHLFICKTRKAISGGVFSEKVIELSTGGPRYLRFWYLQF